MASAGARVGIEPHGVDTPEVQPCAHNPAASWPPCQICYPVSIGPSSAVSVRSLYEQWEAEFKPLLGATARWDGFCYIMRDQLARESCFILETGTLREPGNWKGDGQSTRAWQWIAERKRSVVVSVDADRKACMLASRECPSVKVEQADSVSFMRGFWPFPLTLLYLDSMEWGPGIDSTDCWMNQVAELAAAWGRLPSGCLIASDDSQSADVGKPVLTRRLFEALGIKPEYDGYIVAWRKP